MINIQFNSTELIRKVQDEFPFLSGIRCQSTEIVGIIQNSNDEVISIYDVNETNDEYERLKLLDYGDLWWEQSNRLIPISIFLGDIMDEFQHCLKTFNQKNCEIIFGPVTSLDNLKRKTKRKNIQLVKHIN